MPPVMRVEGRLDPITTACPISRQWGLTLGDGRRSCVAPWHISSELTRDSDLFVPDSRRAWIRLAVAVLIGSLGSVGMWSVVVALPVVQTEFAATRGTASLAFTMMMLGFGSGAVLTGKITDRYGIVTASGSASAFWASAMSSPGCRPRSGNSSWCISQSGCPRRRPSDR